MPNAIIWAACLAATLGLQPASAQPVFQTPLSAPTTKSPLSLQAPLNALARAGDFTIAAGQRGHVLLGDDAGKWLQADVPVSVDLTALSFPDAAQGWAVGHQGVILHSGDGGHSWVRQAGETQQAEPLLDVWFSDARTGFAVGAFGQILHTEDGGQRWASWADRTDNPKELHLYGIRPAAGTIFIVGEQGLVLKLDRAQQRFVQVALPYQGTLFGVVGTRDMALVFGLRGNAFRSGDGGVRWTKVDTGVGASLVGGVVRADGTVVLASQSGQVLVSHDAGVSFQQIQQPGGGPTFAVSEAGKDAVVLVGIGGPRTIRTK